MYGSCDIAPHGASPARTPRRRVPSAAGEGARPLLALPGGPPGDATGGAGSSVPGTGGPANMAAVETGAHHQVHGV